MTNQIIKGFGQGFKQLGEETVEKLGEESQKILESTISGKELLGLDGVISDEELIKKRQEDEIHKQEEMNKIRTEMGQGRNVEGEMEQIRNQKEREKEEKERIFLENLKRQREEERQQDFMINELEGESSNPAKQKKSRGSAFGHKKKSQPDQSQMSQTSEFKGKID
ncbi:MAG: hypothetical protein WC895_00520 [Candidatus Shapirobacteria bacterium]|jgi:hypothetical protein